MKIALTGAHGVGKTTLANHLITELKSLNISSTLTSEVPRVICNIVEDKSYFRRGNNNPLKQALILFGQVVQEIEQSKKGDEVLICDRTILDHWAYSKYLFEKDFVKDSIGKGFNYYLLRGVKPSTLVEDFSINHEVEVL